MGDAGTDCVLLADRHHDLSEAVRGLLRTAFTAVFVVSDEESLLEGAARIGPRLVVADVSLAGGDLAGFVRMIKARAPGAKVLLLTVHDEPAVGTAALSAGAEGVVLKRSIPAELLKATDELMAGRRFCSDVYVR
jgi:DNA-binding NarL/FixJ family response regulator